MTVVAGMALAAGLLPASPASAAESQNPAITATVEADVRARMTTTGVSAATQDVLMAKLHAGQALDSFGGGEPARVFTETVGNQTRTVKEYADGSRVTTSLQTPAKSGGVSTQANLSGCATSGSWKINCKVSIVDAVSEAKFIIDYQTSTSGAAKVRDYRGASCGNTVGGCSQSGGIVRATQSSAGAAWARQTYKANIGPIQVEGEYGIRVSGTSVTTY
ncbi:hypothetical protein [Clavibacter michiganensis]|uniref:hypothetical protein n=1 Tax=Clavibacter michiganensis TaxID=28447 RepID=UPI002931CEDE|nr:hypothetical protein [Clavibacter michiganensis]